MKAFYLILLLIIPFVGFSQTDTTFITYDRNSYDDSLYYETDTIISNTISGKVILSGTTILPFTPNMINAIGHGFELKNVSGSACKSKNERVYKKDTKVIGITKTDTNWICELKVIANCCYDFLCEINIKNDSILNFIYHGYGDYCCCDCCFGLIYKIEIQDYGNEAIPRITHTMINGRKETLQIIE